MLRLLAAWAPIAAKGAILHDRWYFGNGLRACTTKTCAMVNENLDEFLMVGLAGGPLGRTLSWTTVN